MEPLQTPAVISVLQGLPSHPVPPRRDLYSCLVLVRLQAQPKAVGTPSPPLRPRHTGIIQTGQEVGDEANTVCVCHASHSLSHLLLGVLRGGWYYFHLIHGTTGTQRGSQAAQSHPASEGLGGDLNLQDSGPGVS